MRPAQAAAKAAPESASENAGATPRRKRGRPPKTAQGNGGNVGERAAKGTPGKLPKNLALINRIVEIFQEYTEDEVEKIADGYRARARPTKGRPRGRSCRKPSQQ